MLNSREFVKESQKTRTVIRQATCPEGFCLVVDDDGGTFEVIKRLLDRAGIAAEQAESIDAAISALHEKARRIICAVIGNHINGTGSGTDVIREIERDCPQIPYVVYTSDASAADKLARHFPRANVVLQGNNTAALSEALGLLS